DSGTAGPAEFFAAAVRESAGRLKGAPAPSPTPGTTPALSPSPAPTAAVAEKAAEPKSRVRLIGEPTVGMGADYQIVNLPSGGALKLAVAKVRTAGGVSLSPKGLEPDDRVFSVAHQEITSAETDLTLQQGLRFLSEGAAPPAS
ncbi:MAG: S41 family peptidase, partial [Thermoanaerobaculia bacterium]|nr:S41 family peptidase [Thermoanaerobaculia bacterium]